MRRRLFALALALILCAHPAAAFAQSAPPSLSVSLADQGYGDYPLGGPGGAPSYFLQGPGDLPLADKPSSLNVVYEAAAPPGTPFQLAVTWNGALAGTFAGVAGSRQTQAIALPASSIDSAANRVTFAAITNQQRNDCRPPVDVSIAILKETNVRYELAASTPRPVPVAPDLGGYPAPFTSSQAPSLPPIAVILPPQPSLGVLQAATTVMASIGQRAGTRTLTVAADTYSSSLPARWRDANLIYVGRAQEFPDWRKQVPWPLQTAASGQLSGANGAALYVDSGVLMEAASPLNPSRVALAVTGGSDLALSRAASALARGADPAWAGQASAVVAQDVPLAAAATQGAELGVTFAQLGLGDQTLNGAGSHRFSFAAAPPGSANGVALKLVASHPAPVDRDGNPYPWTVRVDVNGSIAGTATLENQATESSIVNLDISSNTLRPGLNTFDLTFTVPFVPASASPSAVMSPSVGASPSAAARPAAVASAPLSAAAGAPPAPRASAAASAVAGPSASGCAAGTVVGSQQIGIVVRSSSTLEPAASDNSATRTALASYPYPFNTGDRLDQTRIILPSRPFDIGPYLRFAADLGRSVRGPLTMPVVSIDDGSSPMDLDANIIVWGTADQNGALASLAGALPLSASGSQPQTFTFKDRVSMVVSSGVGAAGIVEELPSNVDGRWLLVVSATVPAALPLAVEGLSQRKLAGTFDVVTPAPPSTTPQPKYLPPPIVATTFDP